MSKRVLLNLLLSVVHTKHACTWKYIYMYSRACVSIILFVFPSMPQANITIKRTPPCFSLGMDDWLTDIDYDYSMKNEGDNPVNQPVNNEPIEILSQKDLEDFEAGFSDSELM